MEHLIIEIMNEFGYIGITLLIVLENIFPPIPSEVILTFGGFMTTHTSMTVIGVIVFSTVGATVGALILYYIGYLLSDDRLERFLDGKIGMILGFKKEEVNSAVKWFHKKGKIAVLVCRCIPIVRSLISIPAGMSKIEMTTFTLYTFIGSAIWNTMLVCAGAAAGASWEKIPGVVDKYSSIIALGIAVLFTIGSWKFMKKRLKDEEE